MQDEFQGIVMSVREYKELDAIIKVFTKEYGKQMFFVKKLNSGHHHLKSVLQPGTKATFIGKINQNGLSFLSDYKDKQSLWKRYDDVYVQAYIAYFISMCDAVIDDRIVHEQIFNLFNDILQLLIKNVAIEHVALLFDSQLLQFWGVNMAFDHCQLTGATNEPLDISLKYHGALAKSQWDKDNYRLKVSPNTVVLLHRLQKASLQHINTIQLSNQHVTELRYALDVIYDELVGVNLKSKTYLKQLKEWYT